MPGPTLPFTPPPCLYVVTIVVLRGATPNDFVFKKLVESIVDGANPEGDPRKDGGKTKSLGLGITSESDSVKTPGPNLIEVNPLGSFSTVYLLGTLFIFNI